MLRLVKRWGARLPALVAASTLGVVAPVGAQSPFCPTQSCNRTVAPGIRTAEKPSAARVCEVPERFQEIRVELAWLASGVTFPWPLSAHAERSRLEVRGDVPDEAARQEAMRLARLSTSLPVVDALHIRAEMRPAHLPSGVSGDVMVRGVMGVVREVLGEQAQRVKVGMRAGGQVTLRGVVSSYEEKLTISARMRRVPGCGCVVNELTVPPTMHDGRAALPISADGSKVVSVLPAPIQPADAPYPAATWSAPGVAQPQAAPPSRPQQVKPSRLAAPVMPPAADAGTAVRPMEPVPAAPPALAPAPVVPAAKPPLMPKATSGPLRNSTVQPVAHFDAPDPAALGTVSPSSPPSLSEPVTAPRTPARNGPGFAQDRSVSTSQEVKPMSTAQSDIPDLRWPMVVHDEALALPAKPPAAAPKPTKAPIPPVTQAPRPLPYGVSPGPQKPQPSQPIRRSPYVNNPPGQVMPRLLPAPPMVKPTMIVDATPTPPLPKSQPQEQPKPTPGPVLPPVVLPPPPPAAVSENRSARDNGVARPGLFSASWTNHESRPAAVTEKVATVPAQSMPVHPAQVVIQPPKPVVPDKPYVSTALVTFEDEPAPVPVKPTKMSAPAANPAGVAMTPDELRHRVLVVCAGGARDVQVMMRADRHWEVKIKVSSAALAKEVSARVLRLPDMAQPHVHLMLEVAE